MAYRTFELHLDRYLGQVAVTLYNESRLPFKVENLSNATVALSFHDQATADRAIADLKNELSRRVDAGTLSFQLYREVAA